MKKITALLLAAVLAAGLLCSCGADRVEEAEGLSVVALSFPPYDFARAVLGGTENLSMLLPPGTESHSYDPAPQDIIKIQNCDLFICGGGESEAWVESILASLDPGVRVIRMMEIAEPVEAAHDHDDHAHEEEYDEHVWTNPENAELITEAICAELCALDAENSALYRKNCESYVEKLEALDEKFEDIVERSARDFVVFGDRFPFLHFAREYDLGYHAAYPGCSTETEPSAATVAALIDLVKSENVPVVFTIEFSNAEIASAICEETGARLEVFHSCHNVTAAEFESGVTYLDLMNENAEKLMEALN